MSQLSNNSNVHYVKFMRGSIAAWEALKATPSKINDDTLYFIYQDAQTSKNGKLYLGQKLISNTDGDININDIGDIYIDDEVLSDKQILVYNDTKQQWENTSLSTIIDTAIDIMQGATADSSGEAGLVPAPQAGDQTKFLKGNGTWSVIDIPTFDSNIFTKNQNQEITLVDFVSAPVGTIPTKTENGIEWTYQNNSSLTRVISTLEELNQIVESGTESDNIIYMIPNNSNPNLSNNYDEYMIIQNKIEHLGTFGEVNLNDYVTNSVFQSAISNLNNILNDTTDSENGNLVPGLISRVNTIEDNYISKTDIGDLSTLILTNNNTNLVEEINSINETVDGLSERLQWHELNYNN